MTTLTPGTGDTDAALRPPRDDLFRAVLAGVEMREDGEPSDGRTLVGHFARFNEWTEIDSFYEGRFLERIAPGAFKKTMREKQPRVLFNHGHDSLGQQALGEITDLREDDEGAYYEVRLFDGLPDLLMDGLRAGVYGASFRFRVMREDILQEPKASDENPAGLPERTIKEVQLYEFGPVTFPAYEGATAGVRSDYLTLRHSESASAPLERLITFRSLAAAAAPHVEEQEPPADDESAERATQDAPPKDSAGSDSHPDHGRRDIRPRDPEDLSWIHGKSQPTRSNQWSP